MSDVKESEISELREKDREHDARLDSLSSQNQSQEFKLKSQVARIANMISALIPLPTRMMHRIRNSIVRPSRTKNTIIVSRVLNPVVPPWKSR